MLGSVMADVEASVETSGQTSTSTAQSVSETSTQNADSSREDEEESGALVEVEKQKEITSEQVSSLNVHDLNFASVGIKSWKVKKPIGLMFEYSDYKNFSKSLNDGRISSGDQISPDGKNWTPMSEIEDFERFFCQTYLEFERNEPQEEVKQVKEKVISAVGGTNAGKCTRRSPGRSRASKSSFSESKVTK